MKRAPDSSCCCGGLKTTRSVGGSVEVAAAAQTLFRHTPDFLNKSLAVLGLCKHCVHL